MGGISSGRHPHYGGKLKQVAIKFPTNAEWYYLAKRICRYKEISFSEWIRLMVRDEAHKFRYTKMWPCKCTNAKGKRLYNFRRQVYCNHCGEYLSKHHELLYNKR